jgi:hypothetical protein
MDSFDYVTGIIYNERGEYKPPNPMDNLYYQIQTLVYLYQKNPEWPEMVKQDIMQYVEDCTGLVEKM